MLIYTPLAIYHYVSSATPVTRAILMYIRGFFLIGEQYNSWPLWYLLSMIYALIFVLYLLKQKVGDKTIGVIVVSFLLLYTAMSALVNYDGQMTIFASIVQRLIKMMGTVRRFTGACYLLVGIQLAKVTVNLPKALSIFATGFLLNTVFSNSCFSPIFTFVSSVGFFILIISIKLPSARIFLVMRKMSAVIYFLHMYVWSFYYKVAYGQKTYGGDAFFATVIISLGFSYAYATYAIWNQARISEQIK